MSAISSSLTPRMTTMFSLMGEKPRRVAASRPALASSNLANRAIRAKRSGRSVSSEMFRRRRPASHRSWRMALQQDGVGGQAQVGDGREGGDLAHQRDHALAHQRLAAGDAALCAGRAARAASPGAGSRRATAPRRCPHTERPRRACSRCSAGCTGPSPKCAGTGWPVRTGQEGESSHTRFTQAGAIIPESPTPASYLGHPSLGGKGSGDLAACAACGARSSGESQEVSGTLPSEGGVAEVRGRGRNPLDT